VAYDRPCAAIHPWNLPSIRSPSASKPWSRASPEAEAIEGIMVVAASSRSGIRERAIEEERDAAIFGVDA
jgi:hypothetical protein